MVNLEYLALNNNQISTVENLLHLKSLEGLNLSSNNIEEFEASELPEGISVLSMKDNPTCVDVDYKPSILKRLKALEMFDDQPITPTDKFKILGILPPKISTYASQMKQFNTKRQIEKNFIEEGKPVLLNTDLIDER